MIYLASSGSASDPLTYLLNFGALGVMFVLAATGIIVFKPTHDRVLKENDRKDGVIERKDELYNALQTSISDRAIPALTEATTVMKQLPEAENAVLKQLSDLRNLVDRLSTRVDNSSGT